MQSALYSGWVRHRRYAPTAHEFRYRLFMMYLDLAELPQIFAPYWLWSARRPAPARFRRADYLQDPDGDSDLSLDATVRKLVYRRTGRLPRGPIRMLAHLRYFGYCFNPVSFFYCFDEPGERIEAIVAVITNTPWKEQHAYVLAVDAKRSNAPSWRFHFDKDFHVSPFMPMQLHYDWRISAPCERLIVHMQNFEYAEPKQKLFDATLLLKRRPVTSRTLAGALAAFPLMTVQVIAGIHWQALQLWLKRTPVFTHPNKVTASHAHESQHHSG
jgi:uncharacterized protein